MAYDVYPIALITLAALCLVLLGVIAHAVRAGNRQGALQHREVLEALATSREPAIGGPPSGGRDPTPDLPGASVSDALRDVWALADRQVVDVAPAAQRAAWAVLLERLRSLQEGAAGTEWLPDPYAGDGPGVAIVGQRALSLAAEVRGAAAASGLPVELEVLDGVEGPEIWVRLHLDIRRRDAGAAVADHGRLASTWPSPS